MAQNIENAIENVTAGLASTTFNEKAISFGGRGLKLDTEKDAAEVVKAVRECPGMTSLCLEGNTVGCDAAKAIAKVLESQPNFMRALWKDMFTGRLKTEIPKALNYLSSGVMLSGARLVELDLSDNAFGPVGVEGIASLLSSASCHTLQELRLNNNGLGSRGGKILAKAMQDCLEGSKSVGKNLFRLRTFVCGRNRLENEGAASLSEVFKRLDSLEEVSMPQNGIYHDGISAIAASLSHNPKLKVINLNDNTFTEKGARAFSEVLPLLQKLEVINFGDCLIKSQGANFLCGALQEGHEALRELHLNNNEIGKDEGIAIAEAMENKTYLELLELNGNCFGQEGRELIEGTLEAIGQGGKLGSLSDDEGEDEDDEEYHEEESEEYEEKDQSSSSISGISPLKKGMLLELSSLSAVTKEPSTRENLEHFMAEMGDSPSSEKYVETFMKIAGLAKQEELTLACEFADRLFKRAFEDAERDKSLSILTNALLVHLGLIKCEDKKFKVSENLSGALKLLEHAVKQPYFQFGILDVLQMFLSKPTKHIPTKDVHLLLTALYQR